MAKDNIDELPRRRWWIKPIVGFLLVVLAVYGGWRLYNHWQQGWLVADARRYVEKGDFRSAALALQRALQINPHSTSAMRAMADLNDRLGSENSIDWRRNIVEIEPGSTQDALALAKSALRHGNAAVTQQALAGVNSKNRDAQYFTSAGGAAIASGNYSEAEQDFAEALKLDPGNAPAQYNLAVIRVQSPEETKRREGLESLTKLAQGGAVEMLARRALVTRLREEKKWDEAITWSSQLQALPNVEFRDRIAHLELLLAAQGPQLAEAISAVEAAAPKAAPPDVAALLNFLRGAGRATEALRWAATLDEKTASQAPVLVARAACLLATGQWNDLSTLTEKGDWGPSEFARLAYHARSAREQKDFQTSGLWWSRAVRAAGSRPQIGELAVLAAEWKWDPELRDVLWAAAQQPKPEWALQILHESYRAEGNTAGLLRVAQAALKHDATNPQARNNVAMLSLLLKRDVADAKKLARENYEAAPTNPIFASTQAFALHQAGHPEEGLEILRKLPADQLREPSTAAYYALLLTASGHASESEPYRALAEKATLLPEEKALLREEK